jgi:proteasome accessory factor B
MMPAMPGDDAMEPLERLLNLVGLLLETRRPLTFDEIRETLDAYRGDNLDSAKRKFERDKDVLRDYGVPLEMVETDAWGVELGYLIPKERYYLPEIAFTPEEVSALFVAAQNGDEATAAEQGIRKLLYGADGGLLAGPPGGPLVAGSDAQSPRVIAAADAASGRRRVRFGYRTSQGAESNRDVDAYGAVFRGGHWYLVGHDHERDAIRAFRLSRFTSEPLVAGDGGEPPAGFRAADHVEAVTAEGPAGEVAEVAFAADVAASAASAFVGASTVRTLEDGRVVVSLPFSDEGTLASMLLQYGPDAEALAPASLRVELRRRLESLASA